MGVIGGVLLNALLFGLMQLYLFLTDFYRQGGWHDVYWVKYAQTVLRETAYIYLIAGGILGAILGWLWYSKMTKNRGKFWIITVLFEVVCFNIFLIVYFSSAYRMYANLQAPRDPMDFSPYRSVYPYWVDYETLQSFSYNIFKDSSGVYYYSNTGTPVLIKEANPQTFVQIVLKDKDNMSVFIATGPVYFKDSRNVYFNDYGARNLKIITGADSQTFEVVEDTYAYAKDSNHAYYQDKLIPDADTKTFQYLGGDLSTAYAKDDRRVYLNGQIIDGADPVTFVVPNN